MVSAEELSCLTIEQWAKAEQFLCNLIKIPSLSGQETEAMEFLYDAFSSIAVNVEKIELSNSIMDDPEYSSPFDNSGYEGKYNLRILRSGSDELSPVLFNTHVDVVPLTENDNDAWMPQIKNGMIFGRGSCDAKSQICTLYLVYKILEVLDIELPADVITHLVIEEESSSNGTLAMARKGEKADACIVLEPSDLNIINAIRGAVWFRIILNGKAGHSGQPENSRNALKMACHAMDILEDYHQKLLDSSQQVEYFNKFDDPMPLNFGRLQAGNWPASTPSNAILEGVLGFLSNKTKEQVCKELNKVLTEENFADDHQVKFIFQKDCSVIDSMHFLPQALLKAANTAGVNAKICAVNCSSDAWVYNNILDIPTVQFGPGNLSACHCKNEHVKVEDIQKAAEILICYILNYSGVK